MQIKKVLVPVDFSPASTLAVNHGVALARKFGAKLTLLHVVESPTPMYYTAPGEAEKVEVRCKEDAEKALPSLVCPEDQDDLDAAFIVKTGDVQEVIQVVAAEQKADVVVMGTHGRNLFERLLLGSVTQALLRELGLPVLTVCHVSRPLEFKRILFATDFGPGSGHGFRVALDLAAQTGASLTVAHTIDKRPAMTYETPEVHQVLDRERAEVLSEAHQKFAQFKEEGRMRRVTVNPVLAEGEASNAIVRIADETEADFLILGLRKKGAMTRALLGSTAEPVIRAAHVPVLAVPIGRNAVTPKGIREVEHV